MIKRNNNIKNEPELEVGCKYLAQFYLDNGYMSNLTEITVWDITEKGFVRLDTYGQPWYWREEFRVLEKLTNADV